MTTVRAQLGRVPRAAWLILAVALVVHLLVAAAMDLRQLGPGIDSWDYDRHAESIARGDGFPPSLLADSDESALRAPLYPYFLGGVYAVTGGDVDAARYAQVGLGLLTVALIGLLAWQLMGTAVALASMGVAAVFPPLVGIDTALLTEALFVPLELGALAAAIQHRRSGHAYRWALLAGFLAGLACLTRPNGILLLLPLAVALWPGRARSWRPLAAMVGVAVLTVAPWTVRNAIVMDHFVPVSTEGGYVLAGIYNETVGAATEDVGEWRPTQLVPEHASLFGRRDLDEVDLDEELRSESLEYMWDHPAYVAEVAVRNVGRLFYLPGRSRAQEEVTNTVGLQPWLIDASVYGFYAIGLLALAGLFSPPVRRVPAFVWLVPAVFATSALVGGLTRYRAPIDPFIVMLAGAALATAYARLSGRRRGLVVA